MHLDVERWDPGMQTLRTAIDRSSQVEPTTAEMSRPQATGRKISFLPGLIRAALPAG
jgi:hypothetical protein